MASTWTEFVRDIDNHVIKRESFTVPMRPLPYGQAALASLPNKKYDFLRLIELQTNIPIVGPSFVELLMDGIRVSQCLLSSTSLEKIDLMLQWPTNLQVDASWIPIRPFHMCNMDVRITGPLAQSFRESFILSSHQIEIHVEGICLDIHACDAMDDIQVNTTSPPCKSFKGHILLE